jgi:hypothetical protein
VKKSVNPIPGLWKASVAKVQSTQELRRSGASGQHDSRPKRERTRASVKQAALREFR